MTAMNLFLVIELVAANSFYYKLLGVPVIRTVIRKQELN